MVVHAIFIPNISNMYHPDLRKYIRFFVFWIGTYRVLESLVICGSKPTTMYELLFSLANCCGLSLMNIIFKYIVVVICMNFYLALSADVSTDLNYLLSHCRFEVLSFWRKERGSAKFRDSILVSSCGSCCLLVQYLHILPTPMKHTLFDWVWQVATARLHVAHVYYLGLWKN